MALCNNYNNIFQHFEHHQTIDESCDHHQICCQT